MGAAFNRYISGASAFITDFKYTPAAGTGEIAIAPDFPSRISHIHLPDYDGEITCAKGTMLCMGVDVDLTPTPVADFKAGFFGGEGFILQKLHSESEHAGAYITGTGALHRMSLAPGASMRISTGALVAFTSSTLVFAAEMVPGVKNMLFGGEGMFLTKITNESEEKGFVWVQGLESGKFIAEIGRRGNFGGGGGGGIGTGMMLGGMGGGGGEGKGAEGAGDGAADRANMTGASVVSSEMNAPGMGDEVVSPEENLFSDEGFEDEGFEDGTSFDGGDVPSGGEESGGGIGGLFSSIWDAVNDDE